MASPTSTINFLPSEASPTPEPRRSPSPFGRARSPLRHREPGYGHLSSQGVLHPSTSDSVQLQHMVVQLRAHVKQLQQEQDGEMDNMAQLRRRWNDSERDKLELTSAFNSENSDLQAQIAKLGAQLEKGEADKQNVEYELAVARQSVSREKMGATEKEQQLKGIITSQSEKLSSLSAQVQELQIQASQHDREMVHIKNKHHRDQDEQEKRLASLIAERDVLQTGKEEIEQVFHEQESLYSDAQERITELRIERDTQTQTVRQQLHDFQLAAERDETAKRELAAAKEEIKELQERIEKERAAHTESKFNFEIVQCQKRDLEGALSVEKSGREQAMYNMDAMSKQIRELEAAYQEERREGTYSKEQFKRLTAENETAKNALSAEVDQKREVLAGTSKQIDLYQKNFNGLKDELTRAKKRQIYLEETYGGCMRELELLLSNFHVTGEGNLRPKRKNAKGKGKRRGGEGAGSQELSPSLVLETLRHTLTDYQQRLDETSQELKRMKTIHDKLANECEHYKEVTFSRDHMVKDLQSKLSGTVKELEKVKSQFSEQETTLSRLKVKLQKAQHGHESEQTKAYNMADEFVRQLTALENEQENRNLYLHSLYQRLLAGRIVMQEDSAKTGAQGLGWNELSAGVQEEVIQLMSNVNKANEKVVLLESELRTKKEQFLRLEDNHKDALDRLAQSAQQREANWARDKEELEHRYQKKMDELKIKSQKSKHLASDALSKARHDGSAKQELESQMSQLSTTLTSLRTENSSLLAACALLSGALLPVYTRLGQLAAQRRILEMQIGNVNAFKRQARELTQMLSMEPGMGEALPGGGRVHHTTGGKRRRRSSRCLVMRFRVAAIAVMASHRLLYLAGQTDLLFTTNENTSGSYAVPLCLGNTHMPHRNFSGMNSIASTRSLLEAQTASWLTSPDLQARIIASVADLQQLIGQSSSNGPSTHSILQASMSAFESLVSRLAPCFTSVSSLAPTAPSSYPPYRQPTYMVRGSLVRCLGHGLNRLLAHTPLAGVKNQYVTIEQTMIALQNQMVDFLDRLHQAEVERRSLKKECVRLRQETGQLRLSSGIASDLQQEVGKLQEKIQNSVETGKFERVFQELQQALGREQEAQRLLTEQSTRLEELGIQLNVKTTEELEKDHNITEAIKGLSEAKMELRRKEQSVRQLSRQLSQLENERRSLQDSLNAAESALKANTRDRESSVNQLRSIQSAVANTKHHLLARADSQIIDSALSKVEAQLLITAVSSPDMIALQSLVSTFVETQKTAVSRLGTLELEITSHKQHIARLKEELSDACSRQIAEGEVTPSVNGFTSMAPTRDRSIARPYKPLYETERSYKDVFLPLREVSDHSIMQVMSTPSIGRQGSMQVMSTPAIARQDYLAGVGMSTPAGISSSPIKHPRV